VDLEKSAADVKIEEIQAYVISLENQMNRVTKHSDFLVRRAREQSQALFDFSQSFSLFGQSEGDNSLGEALLQVMFCK
jgi:hypothetical protein